MWTYSWAAAPGDALFAGIVALRRVQQGFLFRGGEIPVQPGQHFLCEILILHRRVAKHVPQPGIRIAQKVAATVREGVQQKHLLIGPLDFPWEPGTGRLRFSRRAVWTSSALRPGLSERSRMRRPSMRLHRSSVPESAPALSPAVEFRLRLLRREVFPHHCPQQSHRTG